jgi:hypothetical protein
MSAQFEEDGENELELEAGVYVVEELEAPGYTHAFSGDCDENGQVLVAEGQTAVCTITNTAGVGGFNPGSDVPAPIETPAPTPTPPTGGGSPGSDGSASDGTLGGTEGDGADESPAPTASGSDEGDAMESAAIGLLGDWPVCVPGGWIWVIVNLALYFLALLWLGGGEFSWRKAAVVLAILAAILVWAASSCANNPVWLPVALSILGFLWLRLRGSEQEV